MSRLPEINIAVLLNGCGHRDGSEVHEAVITLLAIDAAKIRWHAIALDEDQARTIHHRSGEPMPEKRNMLTESARIARGRISPVSEISAGEFDALVIPGGSGTAVNLCDFALRGAQMSVHPDIERLIQDFHHARKPIGAICISPILLAGALKAHKISITLGSDDNDAAKAASVMGAKIVDRGPGDICVDESNRLVTTPAYMLDASVSEIAVGITRLIGHIASWLRAPVT